MKDTAPIGLGIIAVAALFGAVAWGISAVVLEFTTVAAFVIGVCVAILTAIVLWLGWRDPAPGPQGVQDLSPDGHARAASGDTAAETTTRAAASTPGATASANGSVQPAPFTSTPPAARSSDAGSASPTASHRDASEGDATQAPGSVAEQAPAPDAIGGGSSAASSVEAKPDAAPKSTQKKSSKPKSTTAKSTSAKSAPAKAKAASAPPKKDAPAAAAEPNHSMPPAAESKPETLDGPRDGGADDLKLLKGVGPGIEKTLNELGFYHFDQVANWGPGEVAWVDSRLRFKGRIQRDEWISQAKILAAGGETEFSQRRK